jgi:hypothetical protein
VELRCREPKGTGEGEGLYRRVVHRRVVLSCQLRRIVLQRGRSRRLASRPPARPSTGTTHPPFRVGV